MKLSESSRGSKGSHIRIVQHEYVWLSVRSRLLVGLWQEVSKGDRRALNSDVGMKLFIVCKYLLNDRVLGSDAPVIHFGNGDFAVARTGCRATAGRDNTENDQHDTSK